MNRALRAEWRKLRSIRSTKIVLAMTVLLLVIGVFTAWAWGHTWDDGPAKRPVSDNSVEQTMLPVLQLLVAALGVTAVTGEYATGMIRTSLTAMPRRGLFLAAKAIVVSAVAAALGLLVPLAIHLCARPVLGSRPFAAYTGPLSDRAPVLLAMALSVVVVAVVALGLGVVFRSTAPAIVMLVVLLFIGQALTRFLPGAAGDWVRSVLLPNLADQLAGVELGFAAGRGLLPPWAAFVALVGYGVVALAAALVCVRGRDA